MSLSTIISQNHNTYIMKTVVPLYMTLFKPRLTCYNMNISTNPKLTPYTCEKGTINNYCTFFGNLI